MVVSLFRRTETVLGERERERFLVAISLTSFHFVVDRWKKTKRWYGIVEYPLSSEFDGFGREISCYGIIEFENFILFNLASRNYIGRRGGRARLDGWRAIVRKEEKGRFYAFEFFRFRDLEMLSGWICYINGIYIST